MTVNGTDAQKAIWNSMISNIYALARIAAWTRDAALLQAAKDGAGWILEHAVVDGDGLK